VRSLFDLEGPVPSLRLRDQNGSYVDLQDLLRVLETNAEDDVKPPGLRIVKKIGEGSYGTVFLAVDDQAKQYALKKCKFTDEDDDDSIEDELEEFRSEAQMMRMINPVDRETGLPENEHVVSIVGFFENWQNEPVLLSEFIAGSDLDVGFSKLDDVSLLPMIARGVFQGLEFLHAKGVTHRDIKPDNIRLEEGTNRVVLIDLGLACVFDEEKIVQRKIQKFTCDDPEDRTGAYGYLSPGLGSALWRRIQTQKQNFSRPVSEYQPLPVVSSRIWEQNDLFAAALSVFDIVLQPDSAYIMLGHLEGVAMWSPALIFKHLASLYGTGEETPAQLNSIEVWQQANTLIEQRYSLSIDADAGLKKTLATMRDVLYDSFDSQKFFTATQLLNQMRV
jgi:hypothetical protein